MTLHRILALALALAIALAMASAHQARAQFGDMPGSPGFGAPPAGPPPACLQLMTLRGEYQKNGATLGAAVTRKAEPAETCKLFKVFLDSESRFIQAIDENGTQCGVSDEVIKQRHEGHRRGDQIARQVCEVAEHQRPTGLDRPFLFDGILQRPAR